jgi:hypothetical protein
MTAMTFRSLLVSLALLPFVAAAAEERPPSTPKPGIVRRLLHPFGGDSTTPASQPKDGNIRNLDMELAVEPAAPKLSETHEIKVTVRLTNKGRKLVQLAFPTTQRIEVLVKNKAGKLVEQWSEDQKFAPDPTLVAINPGERIEYSANLATRDLAAGDAYSIEAFFPNFESLKKSAAITPEK